MVPTCLVSPLVRDRLEDGDRALAVTSGEGTRAGEVEHHGGKLPQVPAATMAVAMPGAPSSMTVPPLLFVIVFVLVICAVTFACVPSSCKVFEVVVLRAK